MKNFIQDLRNKQHHKPVFGGLEIIKYIGPGLLVTVGFIDPGNWASNIAAGSSYGYLLLWMITLSTVMLILLQHNVAHLGIATGLCLSEAATLYTPKYVSRVILSSAVLASVSTSLAEILGGAIAIEMLFHVPMKIGAVIVVVIVGALLFTNSYRRIEKYIIGFVSIIGLSFIYEMFIADVQWGQAASGWITPTIPDGSILIIMSVLGAVVMPHNLFLHSEIIQSRQWNLEDDKVIKKQLDYEFFDTFFSMIVGWAINSAMIILAAATFFKSGIPVSELPQAKTLLEPLLGKYASLIFAAALLFAGFASTITSGMAGGSILAGMFGEPYDIKDNHSKLGVGISLVAALVIILFISDPFMGLIISQMVLSIQLPFTIFLQIYLTSSRKVMGKYSNKLYTKITLLLIGVIVTYLNILLFKSFFD
ncbi:MAG: Nramp family divalent metal transporter [Bacteroidetes bacterium]|nr:Nramp family divalent metal transporter [Bacteroidota bacterium]